MIWILSGAFSGLFFLLQIHIVIALWEGFKYFFEFMMVINTILISAAFHKARKKLKEHRLIITDDRHNQNLLETIKKDFRLTLIFFIMYMIFLVPTIVISIGVKKVRYFDDIYMYVMIFTLATASTLNPALTLALKEDFRKSPVCRST